MGWNAWILQNSNKGFIIHKIYHSWHWEPSALRSTFTTLLLPSDKFCCFFTVRSFKLLWCVCALVEVRSSVNSAMKIKESVVSRYSWSCSFLVASHYEVPQGQCFLVGNCGLFHWLCSQRWQLELGDMLNIYIYAHYDYLRKKSNTLR